MPVELARTITDWVKRGGVLISYSLPGIFNEYGRSQGNGRILEEAFPGIVWKNRQKASPRRPAKDGKPVATTTSSKDVNTFEAALDKGRVVIVDDYLCRDAGSVADRFVTKSFYSRDNIFDLCMRHLDGKKYMYVLNPSLVQTRTGEIVIQGRVRRVVDHNLQRPIIVPVNYTNDTSLINMRLAPAEGTLLEIEPIAGDR